jgi:hypothetical protein
MQFRELIFAYCENCKKHINKMHEKNSVFECKIRRYIQLPLRFERLRTYLREGNRLKVTQSKEFLRPGKRNTRRNYEMNDLTLYRFCSVLLAWCRFQWPRGLRRSSAAERLLGSWVRQWSFYVEHLWGTWASRSTYHIGSLRPLPFVCKVLCYMCI